MKETVKKKGGKKSYDKDEVVSSNIKPLNENETAEKVEEIVQKLNARVEVKCVSAPKDSKFIQVGKILYTRKRNIESFISKGFKFEEVK